jgi:hypothetical protein
MYLFPATLDVFLDELKKGSSAGNLKLLDYEFSGLVQSFTLACSTILLLPFIAFHCH